MKGPARYVKLGLCLWLGIAAGLCQAQEKAGTVVRRPRRAAQVKIIQLPQPKLTSTVSFEQLLLRPADPLFLSPNPLSAQEIGQLAWAAQGVLLAQRPANTVPTGLVQSGVLSLLNDMQVLIATYDGIYRYEPRGHFLEQKTQVDVRAALAISAFGQGATPSGCVILLTSPDRFKGNRQNERAKRMLNLRVGQVTQILQLQATSLGLVSRPAENLDANVIRKTCSLDRTVEPYHMIFVGYRGGQATALGTQTASVFQEPGTVENQAKRVAMIVPGQGFQDAELADTVQSLNAAGVLTVVVGPSLGQVRGVMGTVVQVEATLDQLQVEKFSAVVFVGGPGAQQYIGNPLANAVAGEAIRKGRVVGATSTAPMILASAGLLKGVRVTAQAADRIKLAEAGATYSGNAVERDRLVVTASGPAAAAQFGKTIADLLFMQ